MVPILLSWRSGLVALRDDFSDDGVAWACCVVRAGARGVSSFLRTHRGEKGELYECDTSLEMPGSLVQLIIFRSSISGLGAM